MNQGSLYLDPKISSRGVTSCPDRLETRNARTTEEPSKKHTEGCSQNIHRCGAGEDTDTRTWKANHDSHQARWLDGTEDPVLKYGSTLGRERCHWDKVVNENPEAARRQRINSLLCQLAIF